MTATADALARASRLVSDRVGIIADVVFLETTPEEPAMHWAQSRPSALESLAGRRALNGGNGTSVDSERAAIKAIGESIERYCSAFYDPRAIVAATYDELAPASALTPDRFALFSRAQYAQPDFPYAPFTRQTRVGWTSGRCLISGERTYVPASFVYIPYDGVEGEPPLMDLISTGLACGPDRASALLKALTEVVERDAYSITWQRRLPRPHIDLEHIDDPFVERLLDAFRPVQARLSAVLLTLDIPIAVVLMVLTRTDGPPWTVVASGADVSPRRALVLALEEAGLAWIGMNRSAAAASGFVVAPDYGNLTTLSRHGLAHAIDARLRESITFLEQPASLVRLGDLPDPATGDAAVDLPRAVAAMQPFVSEIAGVDLTTPDVEDCGFAVCRVVVPELQRMDMDHNYPHRGGHRLSDVPVGRNGFNPYPHPFP
jgi:ribosomal protein S12 methylthiotransferase accessory factor